MSDNDEVVALLREIRDLQKAHFEQYRLFTSSAMEQQRRSAAALDQTQAAGQQARERQMMLQEQTLRAMARGRAMLLVGAVVQGLIVGAVAFFAIWAALRH